MVLWGNKEAGEQLQLAGGGGRGQQRQKSRIFPYFASLSVATRGEWSFIKAP